MKLSHPVAKLTAGTSQGKRCRSAAMRASAAVTDLSELERSPTARKHTGHEAARYNAAVIEVVPFATRHQDGVIAVILPIQQREFGIAVTLEDQPDLLDIERFYQRGAGNFWVALADGAVVGTISLLDIGEGRGALRKMFVQAPLRGKPGVGQQLLDTLLRHCAERGVREIYLGTTIKYLAAHRFYEKNGFREISKHGLPPTFPIMAVDTKFYERRLDPEESDARIVVAPSDFSDWAGLLALLRASYAYMDARIDPPSSLLRMDAAHLARKSRDEILMLAQSEGRLVGCAFARLKPDCVYVGKLAVDADFRRRGLARRLLREAERLARAHGRSCVELETRIELIENHATFAALGFVKAGESAHPGFERATSITMRKTLR
jgi:N-acetylglutamate synthase-like GNAT family acetyltransferase